MVEGRDSGGGEGQEGEGDQDTPCETPAEGREGQRALCGADWDLRGLGSLPYPTCEASVRTRRPSWRRALRCALVTRLAVASYKIATWLGGAGYGLWAPYRRQLLQAASARTGARPWCRHRAISCTDAAHPLPTQVLPPHLFGAECQETRAIPQLLEVVEHGLGHDLHGLQLSHDPLALLTEGLEGVSHVPQQGGHGWVARVLVLLVPHLVQGQQRSITSGQGLGRFTPDNVLLDHCGEGGTSKPLHGQSAHGPSREVGLLWPEAYPPGQAA